jgi:hypothetical protein
MWCLMRAGSGKRPLFDVKVEVAVFAGVESAKIKCQISLFRMQYLRRQL